MSRDFNVTLDDGIRGELEVYKYLKKYYEVMDLRDYSEYRDKDIDFAIKVDGVWQYVEVKTDFRISKTGNIVVEVGMDRSVGFREGWLYYCEADILVFYDIRERIIYFIRWKALRERCLSGMYETKFFNNTIDKCVGRLKIISIKELEVGGLLYGKVAV